MWLVAGPAVDACLFCVLECLPAGTSTTTMCSWSKSNFCPACSNPFSYLLLTGVSPAWYTPGLQGHTPTPPHRRCSRGRWREYPLPGLSVPHSPCSQQWPAVPANTHDSQSQHSISTLGDVYGSGGGSGCCPAAATTFRHPTCISAVKPAGNATAAAPLGPVPPTCGGRIWQPVPPPQRGPTAGVVPLAGWGGVAEPRPGWPDASAAIPPTESLDAPAGEGGLAAQVEPVLLRPSGGCPC